MKIFSSHEWPLDDLEQQRYEEEDRRLEQEIEAAYAGLTQPIRDDVELALRAQRKEYVAYAHRNVQRLDRIYALSRRFFRTVTIVGVFFAITQFVLGVIAVDLFDGQSHTLSTAQEGRKTSLRVICAVESAIAETGRKVIAGPKNPPPAQREHALEMVGFPPFHIRHQQQERAADAYVASISKAVDAALLSTGHKSRSTDGLVLHGGQLNCKRLAQIANLGN